MKINARVELSEEEINNIIVGAVESGNAGIRYWAVVKKYKPQQNTFTIIDRMEIGSGKSYLINSRSIKKGLNKILNDPKLEIRSDIKNNIMTDNMDAECYDCIIQVGLFGEIKHC